MSDASARAESAVKITSGAGEVLFEGTAGQMAEGVGKLKEHLVGQFASMRETPEDVAVADRAYRVSADELRSFVERFERLAAEKADLADQQKEVMGEAKSRGYDAKALRKIIAMRKVSRDDLAEHEAVVDMYRQALGF